MSEHRGDQQGAYGWADGGGPRSEGEPRMTRAEMRRAAQAAGRRSGRRAAGRGPDSGGRGTGPALHGGAAEGRRPGSAGRGAGAEGRGRARRGAASRRLIDYPRGGRYGWRRWVPSWRQVTGGFLLVCGGMLGAITYAYATVALPSVNPMTQLQNNVFYWSDGSQMASAGRIDRQNVDLDQVPVPVQWDFLAAENATFYSDSGVDLSGMARAVLHMAEGGNVQSGSTITQQFVKNTYLNQNQTISRKFKEIVISLKIGTRLSKQQILQGYLNTSYFGRDAYGIQAAAQAYYHVSAGKLTTSQGAFLAAAVNEPSVMTNADSDPQAKALAKARWQYVLNRMVSIGRLSPADEQRYLAAGFPTPAPLASDRAMAGQTGYLVQLATDYVESHAHISDEQFNQGGYQIYTTFDKKKVDELAASVAKMEKRHLDPSSRPADKDVQVGAASINPATGAIEAIYGGAGYDKKYFLDNANSTGVPVGSTFKPIDLAAAIDHGAVLTPGQPPSPITPDSKFNGDNGIEIKNQQGQYLPNANDPTGMLHQQNDDDTKWGYITLRKAMEESVNTPYVQLGEYTGYDVVENEALSVGLLRSSLQYDTAGFFIGTSTPSPIRMADAYATFDDHGTHHDPYWVTKVTGPSGQLPGFGPTTGTQAMPATTADTVTDVLHDVVQYGTGTNALALGRPAAGKTGTTDDYKSAWFIGYTPQLSTAIAMFKEDPSDGKLLSMEGVGGYSKVFGADMPTEVWTQYMTQALAGQPTLTFPTPPQLPTGANENGAASPSPSASASTPATTPSATSCAQPAAGCPATTPPVPSPSGGNGNGNGNGGNQGGPGGIFDPSPTASGTTRGTPGSAG
jgi:membrane peptidoglycan carboxypeptidase